MEPDLALRHSAYMESNLSRRLDRTGVVASISCAVHCMVAPIIVLMAPMIGGVWVNPLTHLAIAALVLPVAAFALRRGFAQHGRRWILTGGALGMLFVLIGTALPFFLATGDVAAAAEGADHICEHCCPTIVTDEETGARSLNIPPASIVTFLGGVLLVATHIGNLRCCAGCGAD